MKEGKIPGQRRPPMLINLMKCRKCKQWFHGGMTGWICPYCNPDILKERRRVVEDEV